MLNARDAAEGQPDGARCALLRTCSKDSWVTVSVTDHGRVRRDDLNDE